jgi:segregation and condensation protein B
VTENPVSNAGSEPVNNKENTPADNAAEAGAKAADNPAPEPAGEAAPKPAEEPAGKSGGTTLSDDELRTQIEAVLFATDQPLSARRIAEALNATDAKVRTLIEELRLHYEADDRAFTVAEIAHGHQILTRPEFGEVVKTLFKVEREHKLSQAALETLAIVAYKQPIIRAEIEDIRGVQVQPILKTLQEQGLIRIVGRAESLGRPMLYGTTHKFLTTFGLKSAKDLPSVEELKKRQ